MVLADDVIGQHHAALDSDYEWGEFTIRLGWCDKTDFGRRNDAFYADYQAGRLDVHDYVRFATEAMRRQGPRAAAKAHARFMREVIEPAVRPAALALLHEHRARGDVVLIVTATNEFVTRPIARLLGVDNLIAVELERDATGWQLIDINSGRARANFKLYNNASRVVAFDEKTGQPQDLAYQAEENRIPPQTHF